MNYLDREWAFSFIFYFCDSALPRNTLLITDHISRLEIDFSIFGKDMHYCFPDPRKAELTGRVEENITFFSRKEFASLNQKFQLIIIDLEDTPYKHLLGDIAENLEKNGNLVVFDWSRRITTTLSKLFWHLGFLRRRFESLIENQIYDLHGMPIKLNWYFFVVPGLQKPRKLVRRGFKSIIPNESKSNFKRVLSRAGLFYLQKHHRIIIGKMNTSEDEATFLEQLFEKIGTEQSAQGATANKSIRLFSISGTKILILDALIGEGEFIIRFPLDHTAADRIHKQVELVRFLNSRNIKLVPKVTSYVRDDPFTYYIEEKIRGGTAVRTLKKNNNDSIIPLFEDMLNNVVRIHTQFGEHLTIDDAVFKTYFSTAMNTILENTKYDQKAKQVFDFIKTELFARMNNQVVLRSICHGDLKIENGIFDSNNKLKGIFDWDMGERDGITITDLACLLATSIRSQYYQGMSLANFMREFKTVPDEFIPSYTYYFEATQTSYISPGLTILYYWIDRLYKLLRFHYDSNEQWVKENINPVLGHIGPLLD